MTTKICETEKCKGCGLCQNLCPTNCISMKLDIEGFIKPCIDETKCIGCNLCIKQCIVNKKTVDAYEEKILFWAQSKNSSELSNSTSGGLFGELAKMIIENKAGVVYGAIYISSFFVKHVRADNVKDTMAMKYSKYNQSDTSGIYKLVKRDLQDGRYVLFTGTPCQIVALRQYLGGREYHNLLLMDVLCYGVMSTSVLKDYIKYVTASKKISNEVEVCFRSKKILHDKPHFTLSKNGDVIYWEPFYQSNKGIGRAFGSALINRLSCSECEFQNCKRYSDITVGDFVDVDGNNDFDANLIIINSNKGETFFSQMEINKRLLENEIKEYSLERLKRKSPLNKRRETFFKIYINHGLNKQALKLWKKKKITIWKKAIIKIGYLRKINKKI